MASTETHIEANGLRVYYEVHGEGEPLLLAHGGTATSRSWASHLPAFAEHFRVFTPDSRGHGRTDNPTGELSYRLMADDVAALVEALGLQRPLVLGYSDGGQIARGGRRADALAPQCGASRCPWLGSRLHRSDSRPF